MNSEFRRSVGRLRAFLQRDALTIIKNESVAHFKESFVNEGFTDKDLEKWPDITERRKDQKRKKNGSLTNILTDTGDLGRSVVGSIEGRDVVVSSDLDYAERHNEGTHGMPKRQFMGESETLDEKIERQLDRGIGKILNLIR